MEPPTADMIRRAAPRLPDAATHARDRCVIYVERVVPLVATALPREPTAGLRTVEPVEFARVWLAPPYPRAVWEAVATGELMGAELSAPSART